MVVYSIKDMENLSGIKAHTLRIWEKRYDIIKPKRTDTNIRYYTDEDLRSLLNVSFLNKRGIKISKIARMSNAEIKEAVSQHTDLDLDANDQIETLMLFIFELDAYNVGKILDNYINQIGLERTMAELIYPLLEKLSMAWLTGSFQGVHESFVTQIIKSKIQACIERICERSTFSPKYLIYLPTGEQQELSLLYLHFLLKSHNCKVVNLGNEANLVDVLEACKIAKADYVFTIINNNLNNISFQKYIDQICTGLGKGKLIVTGYQAVSQKIVWPEQTIVLKDIKETIEFITLHQ